MEPILHDAVPVGQNISCSVYTQDIGSTKQSHGLEILHQHSEHLGIFEFTYSDAFFDVSIEVEVDT